MKLTYHKQITGLLFAFLTAFISSIAISYNKTVIKHFENPLVFTILKNGLSAILLSFILISTKIKVIKKGLKKQDFIKLAVISIIGGSIPFFLFFKGLQTTKSIHANLIHKTLFIWVAVLALPFLKEKLSKGQILAYILIFLTTVMSTQINLSSLGQGEMFIFIATLLWAIENIIVKKTLTNISPSAIAWFRLFGGSMILLVFYLFSSSFNFGLLVKNSLLLSIFPSSILLTFYVISWYHALKYAPATLVSLVLVISPLLSKTINSFILHQNMSFLEFGSIFLIFFSISSSIYLFFSRQNSSKAY